MKWAVIASLLVVLVAVVVAGNRTTYRTHPNKNRFEYNSVTFSNVSAAVTVVPQASGEILVLFDPPVVEVTGEWGSQGGTFTCCTPNDNCVTVEEFDDLQLARYYGGVGLGWLGNGLVAECTFSGGAEFNIFSVIE